MDELCLSNEDIGKNRSSLRSFLRTTSGTYFPKFAERACFRSSESERTGNPFGGQTILSLDTQTIEKYLDKLEAKTTVGELLAVKAQAQGLKLVDIPEADEIYTREWALNTAAVTKLLLGD